MLKKFDKLCQKWGNTTEDNRRLFSNCSWSLLIRNNLRYITELILEIRRQKGCSCHNLYRSVLDKLLPKERKYLQERILQDFFQIVRGLYWLAPIYIAELILLGAHELRARRTMCKSFFRVLACIFIKLSTSNYCTHKINKYLQRYPPSPPQGGDGFDHCIIFGMRLYY